MRPTTEVAASEPRRPVTVRDRSPRSAVAGPARRSDRVWRSRSLPIRSSRTWVEARRSARCRSSSSPHTWSHRLMISASRRGRWYPSSTRDRCSASVDAAPCGNGSIPSGARSASSCSSCSGPTRSDAAEASCSAAQRPSPTAACAAAPTRWSPRSSTAPPACPPGPPGDVRPPRRGLSARPAPRRADHRARLPAAPT